MIKALYTKSYNRSTGTSAQYLDTVEKCREFIRKRQEELTDLEPKEFNAKVSAIIYDFLYDKKPVVDEMVNADDEINIKRFASKLYEDIIECGPITAAMEDTNNTDIYCFGYGKGRLFKMQGKKFQPITDINGNELYFKSVEEIETVVNKLAYISGFRLNTTNPIMYATTLQKFRLTASDKSISSFVKLADGEKIKMPYFSLRMGSNKNITLESMVNEFKTIHPEVAKYLMLLAKINGLKVLFSGVPGTGKTTIMSEILKKVRGEFIYTIENTPEVELWQYDEEGNPINIIKSLVATKETDKSETDNTLATLYNLYLLSLREKISILVLGEVRSAHEITIMTEAGPSGIGMFGTIHGMDKEATFERLIQAIKKVNNVSRDDAIEEASSCLDIVVNMVVNQIDGQIRVGSISELVREDNKVLMRDLVVFKRTSREINPETEKVYGHYEIVNKPGKRFSKFIFNSNITDEEDKFLSREATPENPIVLSEVW